MNIRFQLGHPFVPGLVLKINVLQWLDQMFNSCRLQLVRIRVSSRYASDYRYIDFVNYQN